MRIHVPGAAAPDVRDGLGLDARLASVLLVKGESGGAGGFVEIACAATAGVEAGGLCFGGGDAGGGSDGGFFGGWRWDPGCGCCGWRPEVVPCAPSARVRVVVLHYRWVRLCDGVPGHCCVCVYVCVFVCLCWGAKC